MELNYHNHYSSLTKRIIAFLIDLVVVIFLNTIFTITVSFCISYFYKQLDISSFDALSNIIIWCAIFCYLAYFSILDSVLSNGSYGKRILKLVVIGSDGKKISVLMSLIRAIIKYISIFGLLGFVTVLFTKKRQAIHDLVLSTVVIQK